MEQLLNTMVMLSPLGLAMMACAGFGMALAARQALGMERGLRAAAEQARAAAVKTLAANKEWEMDELGRFRRLLDCHIDTIIAEATEFRERVVPSPGAVLESLVSWNPDWKRQLQTAAALPAGDVEKLLKNDLPITPNLARKLELFTAAPARFWERLGRLHDEYRAETDKTVVLLIDSAKRAGKGAPSKRPVLELVDDDPTVTEPGPMPWSESSTAAKPPAVLQPPPLAPRSARSEPAAGPPAQRPAVEAHPPVVAHPEKAARGQRGGLPPPPKPRLRSPAARPDGGTAQGRASTLTDFPIQGGTSLQALGNDWTEVERSPFNATLPGVGDKQAL